MRHEVARADGVHVQAEMCSTCVFRPGNLMDLQPGRLRSMIDECLAIDAIIPCHHSIWETDSPAICRGFFDRHARDVFQLRFAVATDSIVFDS